jgi:hypothetical protein
VRVNKENARKCQGQCHSHVYPTGSPVESCSVRVKNACVRPRWLFAFASLSSIRVQLTYPSYRSDERERKSRKRNDCSHHNILTRTSRAALATTRRARLRAFASITAALTAATSQAISRGSHDRFAIDSLRSKRKTSERPVRRSVRLSRRRSRAATRARV